MNQKSYQGNLEKGRIYYLSRPFSLLGASLWNLWYSGSMSEKYLGIEMPGSLFIESPKGIARQYRDKKQLDKYQERIKKIVVSEPETLLKLLTAGEAATLRADQIIAGESELNLNEAVKLFIKVGLLTANLARRARIEIDENKINNPELIRKLDNMRTKNTYYQLYQKVIVPLIKKRIPKNLNPELVHFLTYGEIVKRDYSVALERQKLSNRDHRYLLTNTESSEKVEFITDTESLVKRIEGGVEASDIISGQTAYRGKISGRVKIVMDYDLRKYQIGKGDIIVSINCNPSIFPLVRKCSGLVTDEGGLGCHAAIVSRELKIPCIIGTKIATKVLKDGDLVEVDADKSTVKIIKKAE